MSHICKICKITRRSMREFKTKEELDEHLKIAHNYPACEKSPDGFHNFKCTHCGVE